MNSTTNSLKKLCLSFFLILISFLGYAQCPSPSNNFPNFQTTGVGLTPATINTPVQATAVWGGDYVVVHVEAGHKYKISQANSEAIVAAAFPTSLGGPFVGFDPIMTLMDNTGTNGGNGAVVGFNDDANGTRFPELEYTATYTGELYVHIDPSPGKDIYNGFANNYGNAAKIINAGAAVTCSTFAVDSTAVTVTRLALTPSVITKEPFHIGNTQVVLKGELISEGGNPVTERGFTYALTTINTNPEIAGTGVTKLDWGAGLGNFDRLTTFTAGTQYSFKAYAINTNGTAYGDVITFTTAASPTAPTFTSTPIENIAEGNIYGYPITTTDVQWRCNYYYSYRFTFLVKFKYWPLCKYA